MKEWELTGKIRQWQLMEESPNLRQLMVTPTHDETSYKQLGTPG